MYIYKDGFKFMKSPNPNKKYRVFYDRNSDKHVDFGAIQDGKPMSQYHDKIGLYSKYDHLDEERKERYYYRHPKDYEKYSADWWSKKYLW